MPTSGSGRAQAGAHLECNQSTLSRTVRQVEGLQRELVAIG
jgi:hypothetical protein